VFPYQKPVFSSKKCEQASRLLYVFQQAVISRAANSEAQCLVYPRGQRLARMRQNGLPRHSTRGALPARLNDRASFSAARSVLRVCSLGFGAKQLLGFLPPLGGEGTSTTAGSCFEPVPEPPIEEKRASLWLALFSTAFSGKRDAYPTCSQQVVRRGPVPPLQPCAS